MKNSRIAFLIVAVLSLFNVLFLPLYPTPEQVMAETGTTLGFYNAVHIMLHYANPWDFWIFLLTAAIFIPAVALFISAMIGKQIPFLISSLVGITLWSIVIWYYCHQFSFQMLFVLDGSGIGAGVWIAIALLFTALVFGIIGKDSESESAKKRGPTSRGKTARKSPSR